MNTEERAAYNAKCKKEAQGCREKCECDNGIEGNPKAHILWRKAWEMGHSAGLHEVEIIYADLVELID